jgi:hypothetical protein
VRQFQASRDLQQAVVVRPRSPALPAIAFPRFLKIVSTLSCGSLVKGV